MLDALMRIDRQWLLWLNGHNSPFFDILMFAASGRFIWMPLYVLLIGCIIWKFRWKSVWIILAMIILITLSDQIANVLKSGIRRPRPCRDPEIGPLVHLVRNYCGGAFGFVSGHAANSFALALFITLLFRNGWISAGMLFWAILVSYSRIYLGAHYPGDVIGGAMIGLMLSWMSFTLLSHYLNRLKR